MLSSKGFLYEMLSSDSKTCADLTYIGAIHHNVDMQISSSPLNRTQIYLTVAQQKTLATMARDQSSSSSALIREAIDVYIEAHQPAKRLAKRMAAAGAWHPNPDAPSLCQLRGEERSF
ncbi:MAG: CopG family transcriptional regulator [Polaromonas sp.]